MGKRKHKERDDSDSEILRKIRRLERRVKHRRKDCGRDPYDSDDDYISENEVVSNYEAESQAYSDYDSDHHSPKSLVIIPDSPNTQNVQSIVPTIQNEVTATIEPNNTTQTTPVEHSGLSSEILEVLGESKSKDEIVGPKIRDEVSKRWGKIIMEGLGKEQRQKLIDSIHIPENFQLLKAPKLNPEIAAVLTESAKNRDKRLEKDQNHLGLGIAAVTNLLSTLIDGEMEKGDIIRKLSEVGQILLDIHCQETSQRRKLITYSLDKKFSGMVQEVKRDSFLFGENLGEKIKATKTAEKSGLQVKRKFDSQPSTSYYRPNRTTRQGNSWRGPPKQQSRRGKPGGPRTQIPSQSARGQPTDRYNPSSKQNREKTSRKTF